MDGVLVGLLIGFLVIGTIWVFAFILDNPLKHESAADPSLWPDQIGEYNRTYKYEPPRNWRG